MFNSIAKTRTLTCHFVMSSGQNSAILGGFLQYLYQKAQQNNMSEHNKTDTANRQYTDISLLSTLCPDKKWTLK